MFSILLYLFVFTYKLIPVSVTDISSGTQLSERSSEPKDVESVPSKNIGESAELIRRKEVADKYIKSLERDTMHWVDPYNMMDLPRETIATKASANIVNSPKSAPLNEDASDATTKIQTFEHTDETIPEDKINVYVSRWIKMILLKIQPDINMREYVFNIPLNSEIVHDIEKLTYLNSIEISKLDQIVSSAISEATVTRKEKFNFSNTVDWLKFPLLYAFSAILFAYFLYLCFLTSFKMTLFLIFLSVNIIWHWFHLYKVKLAHKQAQLSTMHLPSECKMRGYGFWESMQEYFLSFFRTTQCTQYYEAVMVDPFWEVSPSVAIAEAFTATLFQPLSASSKMINTALKQLLDGFGLSHLIFIAVFSFLFIVMAFNYKIKFPFFLMSLEPGGAPSNTHIEEVQPLKKISQRVCESLQRVGNHHFQQNKHCIACTSNKTICNEYIYQNKESSLCSGGENSNSAKTEQCHQFSKIETVQVDNAKEVLDSTANELMTSTLLVEDFDVVNPSECCPDKIEDIVSDENITRTDKSSSSEANVNKTEDISLSSVMME